MIAKLIDLVDAKLDDIPPLGVKRKRDLVTADYLYVTSKSEKTIKIMS